ncbi:hypothetical protein [Paenibacillus agaridevorans]|uniref:hypothetical protein n=1 Tax=Paenibacillus agaridevorans TaxID=171404 RepID=UPI001BE3F9C4|nr:hypothetical protein [Paenibacillus agaridevorans]
MIHDGILFYNVEQLEESPLLPGLRLNRFPSEVRESLEGGGYERGRLVGRASTGCELRFVSESPCIRIGLSAVDQDGDLLVYRGDYFHSVIRLKPASSDSYN